MLNQPGNFPLVRRSGFLFRLANVVAFLTIVLAIWVLASVLLVTAEQQPTTPETFSPLQKLETLLKTTHHSFSWFIPTMEPALESLLGTTPRELIFEGIPRFSFFILTLVMFFLITHISGNICASFVSSAVAANERCHYLQSLFGIHTGTATQTHANSQNVFKSTQTRIKKISLAVGILQTRIQFGQIRVFGTLLFAFFLSPSFTLECLGLLICTAIVAEIGRAMIKNTAKSTNERNAGLEKLFRILDSSISPSFARGWMHAWVSRMKEYQTATRASETAASASSIFLSHFPALYALAWAFLIGGIAVALPPENSLGLLDWCVCGFLVFFAGYYLADWANATKTFNEGIHEATELSISLATEATMPAIAGDQNFPTYKKWILDLVTIATPKGIFMTKANFLFLVENHYAFEGMTTAEASALGFVLEAATPPLEGEIRFDDLNLRRIKTRELGKNLAFIHPFGLLDAPLDALISDFAPVRDLAKIQECAKLARIHAIIMKQKLGYQTRYDESLDPGNDLAFRIVLARAFYLKINTLIILPPKNMDSETQESLFLSSGFMAGKTVLFINPSPKIAQTCKERFVFAGHSFTAIPKQALT